MWDLPRGDPTTLPEGRRSRLERPSLKNDFQVEGFVTSTQGAHDDLKISCQDEFISKKKRYFVLSEEDLSFSLDYLYKIGTNEVLRYTENKTIEEISVSKDGVLIYKGRLMDEQNLNIYWGFGRYY